MRFLPQPTPPAPPSTEGPPPSGRSGPWRWAIVHIPWLDGVTPRGQLVMVSDKRHIAEARTRHPDLPLWHEKELALFGDLLDSAGLDAAAFVAVNRLKLKTRGWFTGVGNAGKPVSTDGANINDADGASGKTGKT